MDQLLANPALSGFVGLGITGVALYLLRSIPLRLFHLAAWSLTVRLTVTGDDEVFDWVNEWLADHAYSKRARTLKLSTGRSGSDRWSLAPGFGTHLFWDGGLVILHRALEDKVTSGGWQIRPKERLTITVFGRSQGRIRRMIAQANEKRAKTEAIGIRVWTSGFWCPVHSKSKRSLDTVFLPAEQKAEIIDRCRWFFETPKWFSERGIPWRYGFLLHGPTGTGKTTLVMALSSHFGKPIYILNLATVANDNELLSAFMAAGKGCIILIEDVDTIAAAASRDDVPIEFPKPGKPIAPGVAPPDAQPAAPTITLSGLLNAIDGVAAPEERLLFMTTNHIERLDSALLRNARIDGKFEIGPLAPEQVGEMVRNFFPDDGRLRAEIIARAYTSPPRPAADWQVDFMEMQRRGPGTSTERSAA